MVLYQWYRLYKYTISGSPVGSLQYRYVHSYPPCPRHMTSPSPTSAQPDASICTYMESVSLTWPPLKCRMHCGWCGSIAERAGSMISAQVLKHCRILQSFLAWTNYNSDLVETQWMLRFQLIEGNMKPTHLNLICYVYYIYVLQLSSSMRVIYWATYTSFIFCVNWK